MICFVFQLKTSFSLQTIFELKIFTYFCMSCGEASDLLMHTPECSQNIGETFTITAPLKATAKNLKNWDPTGAAFI